MPRNYKPDPLGKRYKKYDINILQQAVDEYQAGGGSLVNISKKYDINKSVLYRHCTRNMKSHGGQTVLSEESEKEFIKYINICADWGYPMEAYDLRILVKLILDRLGVTEKRFKNNMPGPDFVASFLKRHSNVISQRVSQNIKRNRAKLSPEGIKKYFQELQMSIENVPMGNIINYDETNLSDDPGRKKIIAKKVTKYPERVMNHSESAVSVMMACTAEGDLLPPYVVYKAQHLYDTWTLKGPKGTRYNTSQSGWFDANIFNDWVKSIALPYFEGKPGRKILIGDNLSSHLSIELIKLCHDQDVQFIFLPANSSYITQPLDVAFFRPMKMAWRNIILQWKKTDGRTLATIPKGIFPQLLSKLMDNLEHNSKDNILAGFRKTGIYPFDPTQVLRRLSGDMTYVNQTGTVNEAVIDILKELRHETVNLTKPKRKRKIEVEAGRSINNFEKEKSEKEIKLQPILPGTSQENVVEQEIKKVKMEAKTKKGKGIGKKTKINDTSQLKESTVITNTNSDDCLDINTFLLFFEDNIEIDHTETKRTAPSRCRAGRLARDVVRSDKKTESTELTPCERMHSVRFKPPNRMST